jgi:hypothetical protein
MTDPRPAPTLREEIADALKYHKNVLATTEDGRYPDDTEFLSDWISKLIRICTHVADTFELKDAQMTNAHIAKLVIEELEVAEKKHPAWDGIRHGQSVIEEEYIEFRDAVFADDESAAFKEVLHLAAMCMRYAKNHAPESVRLYH